MATVHFTLNGQEVACEADAAELLVDTLRERFGLTGTKKACGNGDCGACTVLIDGLAVRSCIYLTWMAASKSIVTIEGIGSAGKLHPVQQAFIDTNAVQCGYCIPGMVITACALLEENPTPSLDDIGVAFSGNLCRCTGYQKILESVLLASKRLCEQ